MKKIFAVVIASLMIMTMSVPAFAESMGTGDKTIDVTASYKPAASTGTVYNVDIVWDSMKFTYTETDSRVWDPGTHTYSGSAGGSWENSKADITVTNHSEAAVNVTISYNAVGQTGITGTIENGTATLKAGALGKPEEADSMTATLKISGTPNSSVTEAGVKIGTITIKIA